MESETSMIIGEQRARTCPKGYNIIVGDVSCEECDDFRFRIADRNLQGIKGTDEWCELMRAIDDEHG